MQSGVHSFFFFFFARPTDPPYEREGDRKRNIFWDGLIEEKKAPDFYSYFSEYIYTLQSCKAGHQETSNKRN